MSDEDIRSTASGMEEQSERAEDWDTQSKGMVEGHTLFCSECNKQFRRQWDYQRHMESSRPHLTGQSPLHQCECGTTFTRKDALQVTNNCKRNTFLTKLEAPKAGGLFVAAWDKSAVSSLFSLIIVV